MTDDISKKEPKNDTTKPREYELQFSGDYWWTRSHPPEDMGSIRVLIEYSAYEQVCKERDEWRQCSFDNESEKLKAIKERDFWHSACAKECNEKDALKAELKQSVSAMHRREVMIEELQAPNERKKL